MNWSAEASRRAIGTDTGLLLPLPHDADPEVRTAACCTLATALGRTGRVTGALRARLTRDQAPEVRASLVLATAELPREHDDPTAAAWTRTLWTDPAQLHVRATRRPLIRHEQRLPASELLTVVTADAAHARHANGPWPRKRRIRCIAIVKGVHPGLLKQPRKLPWPDMYVATHPRTRFTTATRRDRGPVPRGSYARVGSVW
ncbi:HEAT repeat domain-containing protein [Streptomyces caelestis]|uniref:HEAT repeat domain-containing protein n=1 Tax=Streptomyces caelestis TaxID=36816 RepID=UPI00366169CF